MNDLMREMLNLSAIDRRIVAGKTRMGEFGREIAAQERRIEEAREKSRAVEAAVKDKAFATDKANMDIRAAEAEVGEQERKLRNIKNQREYRIVSDRIKELKIMVDESESVVLAGMEELDRLRDQMAERQTAIGEEELKLAGIRQTARDGADAIKARHAELMAERLGALRRVEEADPAACQVYDLALKRTRGDPMAEMSMDGVCGSCFIRQNSSVMNIIHIGKDVKNCRCQGCGRILYVKDAAGGEA